MRFASVKEQYMTMSPRTRFTLNARKSITLAVACVLAVSACTTEEIAPDVPVPSSAPEPTPDTSVPDSNQEPAQPPTDTSDPAPPAVEPSQPPTGPFGSSRMLFGASCDAVTAEVKELALSKVTPWGFDSIIAMPRVVNGPEFAMDDATSAMPEAGTSDTNTQVSGVDEADTLEVDDRSLFVVNNSGVNIVNLQTQTVSETIDIGQGDHKIMLADDTLTVVSSLWSRGQETQVTLFDVSDRGNAREISSATLEGSLVAARSVEGQARLVLRHRPDLDRLFTTPYDFGMDEESALAYNRMVVENAELSVWLPRISDRSGETHAAVDCHEVAVPSFGADIQTTWLATVSADGVVDGSVAALTASADVMATVDGIYVSSRDYDFNTTAIHHFDIEGSEAAYNATAVVKGTLLNQFSMDEHKGHLRVATTYSEGGTSQSGVFVFTDNGSTELEEVGRVEGLGKTERIYAVRFMGDTAAVVTFRQVDPLYLLDLAIPEKPALMGELKIPGYSAYLHPISENLLLGVGQNADPATGRVSGAQITIFDISDPFTPVQRDRVLLGGGSQVEYNHLAFTHDPVGKEIAVPMYGNRVIVASYADDGVFINAEEYFTQNDSFYPQPVPVGDVMPEPAFVEDIMPRCYYYGDSSRVVFTEEFMILVGSQVVEFLDRTSKDRVGTAILANSYAC